MKKYPVVLSFLSAICLLFAACAGGSGSLADDLQKKAPQWDSSGDADIDALGKRVWNLVEGSETRMNQFYDKYSKQIEYNKFQKTLSERGDITEAALLAEMRNNGKGEEADKVVAAANAFENDFNALEIFLKETLSNPDVLRIPQEVKSIKSKLDSADMMVKLKLAKAAKNLGEGASYLSHASGVISKLKKANKALLAGAK
jgi:hypothetical protein